MKATGGDLFFEVFGIIAFIVVLAAIAIYIFHLFTEVIPKFRDDYKTFKDLVHQRFHVLDSRLRDLEDGVNLKKEN